ncbi:MAG: xanthine dehydrogenase [SAR86 cluster bacterium]|uniref:Xanthine dehydrogenase n=1 Tax=SAR86 cluster bacterium TaxID=2030880 RepID=A0A2A5ASE0_9GAMM|nr:MAG: xanthine dehydrogenase [SAR86 cluster bacterium]
MEVAHGVSMQSSQQQIVSNVQGWLQSQKPVWLCTILKTWGSSPRPIGAMMACTLDGELVGSISGGCIEEDFLQQLVDGSLKSQYDEEAKPFIVKYGVTAEEQARLKLPCGGQLHVLLEYIEANNSNREVFSRLLDGLENHTKVSRVVNLESGEISVSDNSSDSSVSIDEQIMTHSLSPMYRLLLLGAGDVAKFVAEMALALEYDVTLCDPRPDYLDNWNVAGVEKVSRLPDDVVRERFSNPYCGIVALAHDPRVDDMALMEALKTDAFYIGAMGSVRTSAARRERLPELGLSETEIARLHAPIGFQINSKTPAEIAIAIMAEITSVRNKTQA